MFKYILKRLLQLIPILIGITFLSFAMMRLAGGDAVTYMYENAAQQFLRKSLMKREKSMGWISRSLFSMRSGLQEWRPETWERAMCPREMSMRPL